MKTFAVINSKGGVGKTTTAKNLAYILATEYKKDVLLVDADPQGNASSIGKNLNRDGLVSVLNGSDFRGVIARTDVRGLDLLPATEELEDITLECLTGQRKADFTALNRFLDVVGDDYDICVIDCPPNYSVSCLNAIVAADRIIIPADTSAYSAEGMERLVKQLDSIRSVVMGVGVSGILMTKVGKEDIDRQAVELMRENAPVHVFETVIRPSTRPVTRSSWECVSSCELSPWCNASRDYKAWVKELCEKEGIR